jgi:hypothetical protein
MQGLCHSEGCHHARRRKNNACGTVTFRALPCCDGSANRDIATTMAAEYFHAVLWKLRRNQVLTALMVYLVGIVMAAVMAAFAVWRSTPGCPIPRKLELQYVVEMRGPSAHRDLPESPFTIEDPYAHTFV